MNKENLHENLHEILRQTWNREISADDALELLEDTLSEVMEANRLLKNVKQSAVDLTAAGMDVLERAKTAEAEVERLRSILKDHATYLRKNGFENQADFLAIL